MTGTTADIVVVVGGVIGTSIAMHLTRLGAGKVVLVEKGHLAGGASGRSGAMVREHYLHPVLVRMARESSQVFHNFADAIGGDVGFTQTGRLLLFGERDEEAVRANVQMNRDLGVNIETLAPSELARIVPNMSIDGVAVGAYEPESGYADPVATTYAYADRARDHGAEILTQTPVTGLATSGGRAPRRRRNDWLGFCQARTAARLWKVGDEPLDERANPSAWRPAWERVRGFSRRQCHHHRRRLSGRPWILSLVPRPGPRSRRR